MTHYRIRLNIFQVYFWTIIILFPKKFNKLFYFAFLFNEMNTGACKRRTERYPSVWRTCWWSRRERSALHSSPWIDEKIKKKKMIVNGINLGRYVYPTRMKNVFIYWLIKWSKIWLKWWIPWSMKRMFVEHLPYQTLSSVELAIQRLFYYTA